MASSEVVWTRYSNSGQRDVGRHTLSQGLARHNVELELSTRSNEHLLALDSIRLFKLLPWLTERLRHQDIDWHLHIPKVVLCSSNLLSKLMHLLHVQVDLALRWLDPEARVRGYSISSYLSLLNSRF